MNLSRGRYIIACHSSRVRLKLGRLQNAIEIPLEVICKKVLVDWKCK